MAGEGLLPGPAELAVFAGAVLVLNATPGVDFLLTVSRTLQAGARAGAAAACGIVAGCVVHALAAAFGLAALIASSLAFAEGRVAKPVLSIDPTRGACVAPPDEMRRNHMAMLQHQRVPWSGAGTPPRARSDRRACRQK